MLQELKAKGNSSANPPERLLKHAEGADQTGQNSMTAEVQLQNACSVMFTHGVELPYIQIADLLQQAELGNTIYWQPIPFVSILLPLFDAIWQQLHAAFQLMFTQLCSIYSIQAQSSLLLVGQR